MTAVQERPAGRLACGARPAGAHAGGRGTGTSATNPAIIREVLEYRASHTREDTAVRYGVSTSTITRWRARSDQAEAAGVQWPTDDDVTYWSERQPVRAVTREQHRRWTRRRILTGGPLFINALGTSRRLQGLAALGWRNTDLAPELGVSPVRVGHLTRGLNPRVHRDTAAAIAALYDRLSMTPGPSGVTRQRAAAAKWAPPLAWDDHAIDVPAARPRRTGDRRQAGPAFDEVAVQRATHGDPVHLRPPERAEAVRRLTARRLSAAEIAERLDTTKRSVARHRSTDPTRRSA